MVLFTFSFVVSFDTSAVAVRPSSAVVGSRGSQEAVLISTASVLAEFEPLAFAVSPLTNAAIGCVAGKADSDPRVSGT